MPQEAVGHLVLSRREFEAVLIGDDIEVEILAVEGSTVPDTFASAAALTFAATSPVSSFSVLPLTV